MKMKVSERFALEQWLSDYPHDISYDEVVERLNNEEWFVDGIFYRDVISTLMANQVRELIDETRYSFECSANELVHGVALHDVMEGTCDD